jgi:hypothetical protein
MFNHRKTTNGIFYPAKQVDSNLKNISCCWLAKIEFGRIKRVFCVDFVLKNRKFGLINQIGFSLFLH